jgi:chitin disaccharide deacetylase
VSDLASRLGHPAGARLLLLTASGLGSCHAATLGVYDTLRAGLATTAGLMMPCPWARHAASRYRGEDVGVELTLNAEFADLRWGPITQAPSLLDGSGGFPRTVRDMWEHADLDEVRRECRAQIERAVLWGFDVSHLGTHLDALQDRPEFFDVYLDLAVEFGLPLRLGGAEAATAAGFPFRRLAEDEGIVFPDRVVTLRRDPRHALEQAIVELEPGVTELVLQPALDTPELRDVDHDWAQRVDAHDTMTGDVALRGLLERSGVVLLGYRELRQLQRRG